MAAALLARRGFRVLLLGHEPERPRFDAGGTTLSRGAGAAAAARRAARSRACFKELDCVAGEAQRARRRRRRSGSLSAGQRLDLTPIAAVRSASCATRVRDGGPSLAAVIERLDAAGALAGAAARHGDHACRRTASGSGARSGGWSRCCPAPAPILLGAAAADHPFRAMAAAPAALATALVAQRRRAGHARRAPSIAARRGLHPLEGGLAALQALLLERI